MKPEKILYALNDIDAVFLDEARAESAPRRSRKFVVLIAAVITLMAITLTAFAAEEIVDWFHTFLERSPFTPESWEDAIVMEDYSEELLMKPVSGIPAYGFDVEGVIDITVVSVRLRPDSLILFYHASNSAEHELLHDHYPGGIKVIALDGAETILCLSAVGRVSEETDSLYWVEYAADVPPVDEIAYIELADGTKLPVP